MVLYNDGTLLIRNMEEADAQIFTDEETAQGWNADISKYLTRIRDQAEGKCVSLTAEYKGHPAGYVNVYITGLRGAFAAEPGVESHAFCQAITWKGVVQETDALLNETAYCLDVPWGFDADTLLRRLFGPAGASREFIVGETEKSPQGSFGLPDWPWAGKSITVTR